MGLKPIFFLTEEHLKSITMRNNEKKNIQTIIYNIAKAIQKNIRNPNEILPYGLLSGEFGIVLFLFYYAKYIKEIKDREFAEEYVESLLNKWDRISMTHTFSEGVTGILILLRFLRNKEWLDIDLSDVQDELDNYLLYHTRKDMKNNNWDFLHGSLGVALYFLTTKSHSHFINEYINYLYDIAEKKEIDQTFKWKSMIYPMEKVGYNFSLSHGISSISIFLSHALRDKFPNKKIEPMLIGLNNFILAHQINQQTNEPQFPVYIIENYQPPRNRLAWCYGDLSTTIALWQAAKATGNQKWFDKALNIFIYSTQRRDSIKEQIKDAGICHGSAGLAMIYNRLYKETGVEIFKETQDFWIKETVQHAHFEDGLAGYKTYEQEWVCNYSLITGISGIGLTFISYLLNDDQDWDQIFLLS
ncbi:MAG: lanthionine synthetase C family protein [Tannerellaceae bacterium]|nr:lanthionine synthetase C family protein [Tannerellaceae bacterium]